MLKAVLVVGFVIFSCASGAKFSYDQLCDAMIHAAKKAAEAYNTGDGEGAGKAVQAVHSFFKKASTMKPDEPQAFLNMATFLSNTHEYEESLDMYEETIKRLGDNDEMIGQVTIMKNKAKYGLFSMNRDKAYDGGKGDILEAHKWAMEQLKVTDQPYRTHHDLATLEIMMCENNATYCKTARNRFRAASTSAFSLYMRESIPERSDTARTWGCMHSRLHVGSWKDYAQMETITVASGLYIHKTKMLLVMKGRDGILTPLFKDGDCAVLSPASDLYPNIADALFPKRSPETFAMDKPVLSLVSFASASFYHWLCEAVPRLIVAQRYLPKFEEYYLLVNFGNGLPPRFITETFTLLFPQLEPRVLEYHYDMTLAAGLAAVTWDEQRCPNADPRNPSEDDFGCAALAHGDALRMGREGIHAALGPWSIPLPEAEKGSYVLFAARGEDVTMRKFDEHHLLSQIADVLSSAANLEPFAIRTFFAGDHDLAESLQLFRGAALVVGAHGGALSNIIACEEGTLVLEIGFETAGAAHYEHLAKELGLLYRRVRVRPDEKHRALGAPRIDFDESEVLRIIFEFLREKSNPIAGQTDKVSEDEF